MGVSVVISTASDGNMYDRHDAHNQAVIKNRSDFLSANNMSIDHTTRIDGNLLERSTKQHEQDWCRYTIITNEMAGLGMQASDMPVADALATTEKGLALFLPVADCVGMAVYDPVRQVLMVSHLGRHSLEQDGGVRSIDYLVTTYDSDPTQLLVWLTPAAGKQNFPIWALDNKGMKEVTFEQLTRAGISPDNITDNPTDTTTDTNYYSYSEFLKGNRSEDGDHAIVAMMN